MNGQTEAPVYLCVQFNFYMTFTILRMRLRILWISILFLWQCHNRLLGPDTTLKNQGL